MDGNELKKVLSLAVDALGQQALEFLALVDPPNPLRAADPDEVEFTCPACSCDEIKAAVALVSCYRHPDEIGFSDLDGAYSTLASNDIEHSPSP